MKRLILICLAALALTACNSQSDQQRRINQDTNGQPGSWQCIEHYGDQSDC